MFLFSSFSKYGMSERNEQNAEELDKNMEAEKELIENKEVAEGEYTHQEPFPLLNPVPLFLVDVNSQSVNVSRNESVNIEVSVIYFNHSVKEPDTISFSLDSPIGEVPPFVNATFDPDKITIRPEEQVNSTLTLKIDQNAPIGKYYLSACVKSSRFGRHDRYDGIWVCGECGSCFYLNVIPAPKDALTS